MSEVVSAPPPPSASVTERPEASAAVLGKVHKVLQTPIGDGIGDLLAYLGSGDTTAGDGKSTSSSSSGDGAAGRTADSLADLAERRTLEMHKKFLKDFAAVYHTYEDVSRHVRLVQSEYKQLQSALDAVPDLAPFTERVEELHAELAAAKEREREIAILKEKYHFREEEQRALAEDPVTPAYLELLESVREVYRQSRAIVLDKSSSYGADVEGAAALMESTYEAIVKATEKIARYLLALASESNASNTAAGAGGRVGAGMTNLSADVPEVSAFFLRCLTVLREESRSQWERVLDEAARLRRGCVLKLYFRLMTTGSSSSSSSASLAARGNDAGTARRPLEAEVNNPVFFFSSLFAWLHQSIAEETEFIATLQPGDTNNNSSSSSSSSEIMEQRAGLLQIIFSGVNKHVTTAIDTITARMEAGIREHQSRAQDAQQRNGGPGGLTGGLARLVFAATGKSLQGGRAEDAEALRYASVSSRAQQEQVAQASFGPMLARLRDVFTLLQLFHYYGTAVFAPLIGEKAPLTVSVTEVCTSVWRPLWARSVEIAQSHLLDSTAALAARTATLHRLATAFEAEHPAADSQERRFVLDFLIANSPDEAGGGQGDGDHYSGNARQQQRVAALDLSRVLTQLILPVSPELASSAQLLAATVEEAVRQDESIEALREKHVADAGVRDSAAVAELREVERSCVELYVQSLLSVPLVLAQKSNLKKSLDSFCCALIEYNCFSSILAVMRKNKAFFAKNPIVRTVEGKTQELEDKIVHHLLTSTRAHFFGKAEAEAASGTAGAAAPLSHKDLQHQVRLTLEALYNFYAVVAASGRLTPLPLLGALRSSSTQAGIESNITRQLSAGVYTTLYNRVSSLIREEGADGVLTPEQHSLFVDMAPQSLSLLTERGKAGAEAGEQESSQRTL